MRRFVGSLFVLVLLFAVVPLSWAQLRLGAGPHAGVAFSSFKKPAGDLYGTGFLFGAHGDVDLNRFITLRLTFDYATFSADEGKLAGFAREGVVNVVQEWAGRPLNAEERASVAGTVQSASGAGVKAPSVTIAGLGKIPTGSTMIMPYGTIGLGVDFLSFSDVSFQSTGVQGTNEQNQTVQIIPQGASSTSIDSETKFSLQFGAGSEFKLSSLVKLFFEVKYHMIFTSDGTTSYVPLVLGATFAF